jgi:HK97 gp10 family phage protein
MISFKVKAKGLKESQEKLRQVARDMHGQPMQDGMEKAALMVTRSARIKAPVDTGRLRSSIMPEVRVKGTEVQGVIGSNVTYAPFVELGTKPHFPPIEAVAVWAARHGMSAYAVALAIARRGTKAHPYLQPAFDENRSAIEAILGRTVQGILNK